MTSYRHPRSADKNQTSQTSDHRSDRSDFCGSRRQMRLPNRAKYNRLHWKLCDCLRHNRVELTRIEGVTSFSGTISHNFFKFNSSIERIVCAGNIHLILYYRRVSFLLLTISSPLLKVLTFLFIECSPGGKDLEMKYQRKLQVEHLVCYTSQILLS